MSDIKGYISIPFHGEAGESAYEIAKKYGYTGTEEEWVNSLGFIPDGSIGKEKLNNELSELIEGKSLKEEICDVKSIVIPGREASANLLNPANVVVGTRVQMIDRTTHFEFHVTQVATYSYVVIPIIADHKYKMVSTDKPNVDYTFFWASGTDASFDNLTPISKSTGKYATADETIYAEAPEGATYLVYSSNDLNIMVYDYTEHGLLTEWVEYFEGTPEITKEVYTIKEEFLPDLGIDEIKSTVEELEEKTTVIDALELKSAINTYLSAADVDVVSGCLVVDNTIVTTAGSTLARIEANGATPAHNKYLPKGKYYLHFDLERANDDAIVYVTKICMPNNVSANYSDITVNSKWGSANLPTPENCPQLYHYVFEIDTENIGDISTFGIYVYISQTMYDEATGLYKIVSNGISKIPSVTIKNFGLSDNKELVETDVLFSDKLSVSPENLKGNVPLSKIDTDLYKLNPLEKPNYVGSMASLFRTWGCIGDSLTQGQLDYNHEGDTTLTGYNGTYVEGVSYPSYFARALNAEVANYGKGGDCAKPGLSNSWLTWANGTDVWTSPKDAYIIALGTNDRPWDGDPEADIDLTDYNNNAQTSVGGYATIIQKVLEIQPKAKIFLVTHPHTRGNLTDAVRGNINSDIRKMAEMFGCYVIDLELYGIQPDEVAEWKKIYYASAHLNALGYKWLADTFITYIDWIINNNPEDFRNTGLIGTDYEYRY